MCTSDRRRDGEQRWAELYSTGYDVIVRTAAEYRAGVDASSGANRDQLATIVKQLKDNTTAVDRYLTAFERGPSTTTALFKPASVRLLDQARLLRARKVQLESVLEEPFAVPEPAALSKIRARIREIFDHGNHVAKKALFEALIEEV